MVRLPKIRFDRGTLIIHPPPPGKSWIDFATWDDRIEKFRIQAIHYHALIASLKNEAIEFIDEAKAFAELQLQVNLAKEAYTHQEEGLLAWKKASRRGVIVLPTGSGKSYLAQMAIGSTPRSTLIVVPTLDLMHQWYAQLVSTFSGAEIGLLGGGSKDRTDILISTYDSAAIHAETLGNKYALIIFDECHHLPSDFNRVISEYSIAPYRLGLTATPDRSDGRHQDLDTLIGPVVYRKTAEELSGQVLAPFQVVQLKVQLSTDERTRYQELIDQRNAFLNEANIWLSSTQGWQRFVRASAQSSAGRRAMLAHREAKNIALGTEEKLRVLEKLLAEHYPSRTIIFTDNNATVYRISQEFLIPAITHQTPVKERYSVLQSFRNGDYTTLVVSHVLNEGVDVPEARIAILLSGSGSTREYIQRLGRILRKGEGNKLALLYEVIAEETTEERISQRRRKSVRTSKQLNQLELLSAKAQQSIQPRDLPKVAEDAAKYLDG